MISPILTNVWTLRCMGCNTPLIGEAYSMGVNMSNRQYTSSYQFSCKVCEKTSIVKLHDVRKAFIIQRDNGTLPPQVKPGSAEWVKLGGYGWGDSLIKKVVA